MRLRLSVAGILGGNSMQRAPPPDVSGTGHSLSCSSQPHGGAAEAVPAQFCDGHLAKAGGTSLLVRTPACTPGVPHAGPSSQVFALHGATYFHQRPPHHPGLRMTPSTTPGRQRPRTPEPSLLLPEGTWFSSFAGVKSTLCARQGRGSHSDLLDPNPFLPLCPASSNCFFLPSPQQSCLNGRIQANRTNET